MKRSYFNRQTSNDGWNITEMQGKKQRIAAQQKQDSPASPSGVLYGDGGQILQNALSEPLSTIAPILSSAVSVINDRHSAPGSVQLDNGQPSTMSPPSTQNLMFRNVTMVDNSNSTTVIAGQTVMDKLRLHIDSNAAVDSSARVPPPTCHPKTRLEIRKRLTALLHDVNKACWMLWLFGAAGTGKSAVGQTFASECEKRGELGAAFFFSRPNGRNRYNTVIPTLAYQLATHCPPYRSALITKIDHDYDIFNKQPPVQLKKLIIEPLLQVRSEITTTFLMLLDGVDECGENMVNAYEREEEQIELVKIIAESVHDYPGLPLFWLLCSRPEEHLQVAFADAKLVCGRENLVIDAQCREEVETVLREGFGDIVKDRRVIVPGPGQWPSKDEFDIVEQAVAGLHVFGAAILKDIKHSPSPVRQLKSLIPFLKRVTDAGYPGSIKVMDLFYTRILGDIPDDDLPTTLRIIGALITMPEPEDLSAQALCNFLHLDPNDFSSALRMVHSIINIPSPENIHQEALHLYHASLSDFLTDVSRSRMFHIDEYKALVDLIKTSFHWHISHYNYYHRTPARPLTFHYNVKHDHGPLHRADFTWITSTGSHEEISDAICVYVDLWCFYLFEKLPDERCDEELLSIVHDSDLRYIPDEPSGHFTSFLQWIYKWDSSGFIRTKPENDTDELLLTTLEAVLRKPATSAQFPLKWYDLPYDRDRFCEYVFFGRDLLTIIVVYVQHGSHFELLGLSAEHVADKDLLNYYEECLQKMGWYPKD